MGYFKTKTERVETLFTEEEMEKWERNEKIARYKEVARLKTMKIDRYFAHLIINAYYKKKGYLLMKKVIEGEEKKKEEAPPSLSQKGPFTYETHSLKETKDLRDKIRYTAGPGTVINWVVSKEEEVAAKESDFVTSSWSSSRAYEKKTLVRMRLTKDSSL